MTRTLHPISQLLNDKVIDLSDGSNIHLLSLNPGSGHKSKRVLHKVLNWKLAALGRGQQAGTARGRRVRPPWVELGWPQQLHALESFSAVSFVTILAEAAELGSSLDASNPIGSF